MGTSPRNSTLEVQFAGEGGLLEEDFLGGVDERI